MSKISLRWRITLLMGVLLLSACTVLTVLSIQNMAHNFTLPLLQPSVNIENNGSFSDDKSITLIDGATGNLPDGTYYVPEIKMNIEQAQRSFSIASYFYMVLVVAGGMLAAYHLAGRAMHPLSKLECEMKTIGINNLSKRITVPQTSDEIANLSASFNELLTRLEQDFEKEKRFSAHAAHELKTPLATIMTSAQVLAMNDEISTAEYRENLDITLQSVRRLTQVVHGLLLLGGASMDTSFEAIDSTQMLYAIQKEIEPLYREKNIALTHHLQAITLNGNPVLLYRAFFNLVENAFKYTEENGSVTISSSCQENACIICIADTGIGIPADDLKNIFEPFYRADKSRSRKIAGAGLGLSIAKEIFNLHKATISISSEHGAGTVVEVRFTR